MPDLVNHPEHYAKHRCQIEPVSINECLGFNLGNCLKYVYRAPDKGTELLDLQKSSWYIHRFGEQEGICATPYDALVLFAIRRGAAMHCSLLAGITPRQICLYGPIAALEYAIIGRIHEIDPDAVEEVRPSPEELAGEAAAA